MVAVRNGGRGIVILLLPPSPMGTIMGQLAAGPMALVDPVTLKYPARAGDQNPAVQGAFFPWHIAESSQFIRGHLPMAGGYQSISVLVG